MDMVKCNRDDEETTEISGRRVGEEDVSDRRVDEETLDTSDRLSSLPNDLIYRILSLMPSIEAVRTSVLSSKWRSVYTCVPSIDIDDTTFPDEYSPSKYFFYDVLHKLIAENTNGTIPFFCISCYDDRYTSADISSWILAAVRKNVKVLHLSLSMRPFYRLPQELYACTSLVTLSMHNVWIRCLGDGDFPKLKDLVLYFCVVDNTDSTCAVSKAPFLERLCLHGIFFTTMKLHLSLPSLKSLCLRYAGSCSCEDLHFNIVLNTPNLRRLTLHNYLPGIEWETAPTLLSEVRHHISDPFHASPSYLEECGVRLAETLNGFCCLKELTLSSVSQKVLLCSTIGLPVLQSLKHLKLRKYDDEICWRLGSRCSELAPNLDVLDLDMVDNDSNIVQTEDCFPKKRNCYGLRIFKRDIDKTLDKLYKVKKTENCC